MNYLLLLLLLIIVLCGIINKRISLFIYLL